MLFRSKNLIGRAGRSKSAIDTFDYGFVVVPQENYNNFLERINIETKIKNTSELDNENFTSLPEDVKDLVEATRNNISCVIISIGLKSRSICKNITLYRC